MSDPQQVNMPNLTDSDSEESPSDNTVHVHDLNDRNQGSGREPEEPATALEIKNSGSRRGRDWESAAARMTCLYWVLMMVSVTALLAGGSLAWLLGRLYFLHGGSRRWLYASLQSMGWPILLFPLALSYCNQCQSMNPFTMTHLTLKTVLLLAVMGGMTTVDNLLYSWGQSNLPVSTDSLLCSSQLAFSAVLACLLLKQKMSHYMINAFVLITISTVVLIIHSHSHSSTKDRKFIIGCVMTVAASGLYAFMLTVLELIYVRVVRKRSFVVVLEIQIIISMVATFFSILGMWMNEDLSGIKEEADEFGLGKGAYVGTLVGSAVGWQIYIVGGAGIIFLASSLMSCVLMTAMVPLVPVLAVLFFHDAITLEKLISLILALWGFSSYVYGAYATTIIRDHTCHNNMDINQNTPP